MLTKFPSPWISTNFEGKLLFYTSFEPAPDTLNELLIAWFEFHLAARSPTTNMDPFANVDPALPRTNCSLPLFHTLAEKLIHISDVMLHHGLTPKKYLIGLLTHSHPDIVLKRSLWHSAQGHDSTFEIVDLIRQSVCSEAEGQARWQKYILAQAEECVQQEGKRYGEFKKGPYLSSSTITTDFLSPESKASREDAVAKNEMPFFYNLTKSRLLCQLDNTTTNSMDYNSDDETASNFSDMSDDLAEPQDTCVLCYTPLERREKRVHVVAANISSMVQFISNRRVNALQMFNSLLFLACGLSERINSYLSFIGISSSRKTAQKALVTLGLQAEQNIISKASPSASPFGPLICIDNVDLEQSVRSKSINRENRMFHGTWGYLHTIDSKVLATINPLDLTLQSYKNSIAQSTHLVIKPALLIPSNDKNLHLNSVIKSQIARVLLGHLVCQIGGQTKIPLHPPAIDPITPHVPDITMLKLMVASNNSSEGIADVFESIINQTDMNPKEFYQELRVFEGDLGTCMLIESLRTLRRPSDFIENSLSNCVTLILGASHILWNFAQAFFLMHFGDHTNSQDLGAWHTMSALGIPSERPVLKKDFTLMISNLTKVHEATILQCLMTVMGANDAPLPSEKAPLSKGDIDSIIELCYERYFSPNALRQATTIKDQKHINLLLRLRDFATVVECNRSMRAGDIGRLMNVWRRWSIMAQGIKGLNKYAIHLPRMVLLLTRVLPPGLRLVLCHSLLISPKGRPGHFVAKDFYLEVQNYWLKYFYNNTGRGTEIHRLMEVYSINISMLQSLVNNTKGHSGLANIYQSHKNLITHNSLKSFLQMARQYNICSIVSNRRGAIQPPIPDIDALGMDFIVKDFEQGGGKINRFNPATSLLYGDFTMIDEVETLENLDLIIAADEGEGLDNLDLIDESDFSRAETLQNADLMTGSDFIGRLSDAI
ncbi:hypothetical protein MJO29_015020 [Puccinia striiformis f. sp. tritici]|nr:hypothetical protein MJO29_015020 [Puccinia striiformis f. sp. tritici]